MPKIPRCLFAGLIFFMLYASVCYASSESLGIGNFSIKVDQIQFIDDLEFWEFNDIEKGYYAAIDWYGHLGRNFYFGAEVGYTSITGEAFGIDTEITVIPVEINLKYALAAIQAVQLDFGIGASHLTVYGEVIVPPMIGSINTFFHTRSIYGGQGFINFNFKFKRFFWGANAKYQITEDLVKGLNLDNYRVGVHVGLTF